MTTLDLSAEDVRKRLAQQNTPQVVRSERTTTALMAVALLSSLRKDLSHTLQLSGPAALLLGAVLVAVMVLVRLPRLRVREAKDFSDHEVATAVSEAVACRACGAGVLSGEWACPRCRSWRHQLTARPEFLPLVAIPLVAAFIYGLSALR